MILNDTKARQLQTNIIWEGGFYDIEEGYS